MLRCADGSYYTGAARDLRRRLLCHQAGTGSRFTRARLPVTLAWCQEVATWSEALREEYRIKRLSRVAKQELVSASEAPIREEGGSPTSARGSQGNP